MALHPMRFDDCQWSVTNGYLISQYTYTADLMCLDFYCPLRERYLPAFSTVVTTTLKLPTRRQLYNASSSPESGRDLG